MVGEYFLPELVGNAVGMPAHPWPPPFHGHCALGYGCVHVGACACGVANRQGCVSHTLTPPHVANNAAILGRPVQKITFRSMCK